MTDCKINLVPKDIFINLAKSSSDVSFALAHKILEQFALYASRVNNLEFKSARERLAYRLLILANKFGTTSEKTLVFPHISQEDIAATIHLTRESISIEMSRFERLGLVELTHEHIVIKNPKLLQRVLGEDTPIMFLDNFKS